MDSESKRKIYDQWDNIQFHVFPDSINKETNTDKFWLLIKNYEYKNHKIFENLAELALLILCIPESNASSERVWSLMNIQKSKLRNRLDFETMRSLLLSYHYIRDTGGILNFKVTKDMMEAHYNLSKLKAESKAKKPQEELILDIEINYEITSECQEEENRYGPKKRKRKRKADCKEKTKSSYNNAKKKRYNGVPLQQSIFK